jgi:branched-chain amino acid aminotransferase
MIDVWRLKSDDQKTWVELVLNANTLDAGSQELPPGVYTTFRTYHHDKVLRLHEHFDRLVTSAELQNVLIPLDPEKIRMGLREVISGYPEVDVRLRIHWSLEQSEPTIFLMGEKFTPIPEDQYYTGVAAQTIYLSRENPLSKATSFINKTHELRASKPVNIHEYILVSKDGELLEGMTSNVFCIKNGVLYTASSGILLGTTRQLVLEAVGNLAIPEVSKGLSIKDLAKVDEVFITSASRGVLPVTLIDGKKVGSGKPGNLTQRIIAEFTRRLEFELELI